MGEAKRRKVKGRIADPKPTSRVAVSLANPEANPVVVEIHHNPVMGRWDVVLIVGNFATEADANAAGEFIIEMAKREFGVVDSDATITEAKQ